MDQGASVLCEQGKTEEILIEHVPVRETLLFVQPQNPASSEPSDHSMTALVSHMLMRMQTVGDQYAKNIHSATKELKERVEHAIGSGPISRRRKADLRHEIKNAENEFEDRILQAAEQMNLQREILVEEIRGLDGCWNGGIFEKIAETENAVAAEEAQIQKLIEDHSVDLTTLMRANAAHKEMKAFLSGLKLRVQKNTR